MAESALAPLRLKPHVRLSRSVDRPSTHLGQPVRPGWAREYRVGHFATRRWPRAAPALFAAALVVALLIGWLNRDQEYLVPDSGLGYWLGIAGASLMLLLLLYPLRKRMRSLRTFGSVVFWFRLHMALGLIGPTLILFHANFRLGSLNSNVAMFAMLLVAASGIVGRCLYRKILAAKKPAVFAFYERLFGLWHALHLPLFIILVLAAGLHVLTAHLY